MKKAVALIQAQGKEWNEQDRRFIGASPPTRQLSVRFVRDGVLSSHELV